MKADVSCAHSDPLHHWAVARAMLTNLGTAIDHTSLHDWIERLGLAPQWETVRRERR